MTTYEDIMATRAKFTTIKNCLNAVMPTLDMLISTEESYKNKIEKQYVPTGFETKVLEIVDVGMSLRDGAKFEFVGNGVLVTDVSEESKAGLEVKPGYLITEVAGEKCDSLDGFNKLLDDLDEKGDEFILKVKLAKAKTLASYLRAENLEMKSPCDLDHEAFESWVQKTRSAEQIREKGLKKWTSQREEKIGDLELSLGAVNNAALKEDVQDLIKRFRDDFDRRTLGNFNFDVKKVTTSIFRVETDLLKQAKDAKAESKEAKVDSKTGD